MKRLWAPWRIGYITKKKEKGVCLFCKLAKDKSKDTKNLVFLRSKRSFSLLNKFPYNNGHVLICPLSHKKHLKQLSKEEILDLMSLVIRAQNLLEKTLHPEGYNIGINVGSLAGAGIDKHLHVHLVPRWRADVNFMPVTAKTKVISQSLKELHKLLKKKIKDVK